jgi:hypothetical protein
MLKITCQGASTEIWRQIRNSPVWARFEEFKDLKFDNLNLNESDIHFFFDYPVSRPLLPGKFNVLVLLEPEVVYPFQYKSKILSKFDLIIPVGEYRAKRLNLSEFIQFPVTFIKPVKISKNRYLDFIILNANKFSANKRSNYKFRRKISRYIYESKKSYALYGKDWKMSKIKEFRERIWAIRKEVLCKRVPNLMEAFSDYFYKYPEFKGSPDLKQEVLTKAKFAIIIENESDYVSEKIFDAILSGCVPIYVGPSLSNFEILSSCCFQIDGNVKNFENLFSELTQEAYLNKYNSVFKILNNPMLLKEFTLEYNIDRLILMTLKKLTK